MEFGKRENVVFCFSTKYDIILGGRWWIRTTEVGDVRFTV